MNHLHTIVTLPFGRLTAACLIAAASSALAADPAPEIKVTTGRSATDAAFKIGGIPGIATNDAATKASLKIVSGNADPNCGVLDVIRDGRGPNDEDAPGNNFFFSGPGGRLTMDLGSVIDVKNVASFSWHPGPRAGQVYKLYGADGAAAGFQTEPGQGVDPATVGWKFITEVDTHDKGTGQQAVSIATASGAPLGKFRHLLFDIRANADPSGHGNTFFSEIDVIDANGPEPKYYERVVSTYHSKDGKYHFILDATEAPDLAKWCEEKLMPVMEEWYPKIIGMIPVDGYTPTDTIRFTLKNATTLPGHAQGVPGYATGNSITLNATFMRQNATGEAIGCAVHEIVHIVQFGNMGRTNIPRPPTWFTEGLADYIRWFLYEPQSKGAEITKGNVRNAKYSDSYRVTANFLDWVVRTYDKDLIRKMNVVTHTGYSEDLWKQWTGKTLEELNAEWKAGNLKRLGME
ncbi:hypothetical protein KBB96_14700 [Luteolibacter ambystomatis]|uniref:Plant Basic Secretory Protein n=1 Tax=Luteolibacter ambystomatis TaxID=2824561 RepID=A0A975G699_9BACT|nr:basic secretory protein-like protein [Luteolibacter ambystomatis]QUE50112.1 hypothetical protein KBB96_14700 [Luteolibacter ambystomatis]